MDLSFSSLTQFCLYLTILVTSLAHSHISHAQVTSDGTVNTQVNQNANVAEITGGETRGSNLFHSFQDFSVGNGGEAFFDNAQNIDNILSRVTGGNISNINGTLSANGSANLFLINPAGIVFGNGARLDLGGSFYGSSASSILFEDGEFSAANLDNPPLLTVNAPIGFTFRDNPGEIINRSDAQSNLFNSLRVPPGENLFLLGGNIIFDNSSIEIVGGNVELGGLSEAGTILFNNDGSLEFPVNISKSNVDLIDTRVDIIRGEAGGGITINAANLNIDGAEGQSFVSAGSSNSFTPNNTQPADIEIQVDNNLVLNIGSINTTVGANLTGDGGNITIDTSILELSNGSEISSDTSGEGNAGAINITADDITINDGRLEDGITSEVEPEAVGNAGEINLTTGNLTLTNGGQITASTFGQGDAGSININARETIRIDSEDDSAFSENVSGITSTVGVGAQGNAGNLNIVANNLNLSNGVMISASTFGQGNSGLVDITATDTILVQGESSQGFPSGFFSTVGQSASGNSEGISIFTDNLNLTNGGQVNASTFGEGNSGLVDITATDTISFQGETSQGIPSAVFSTVSTFSPDASGNSEGISIFTDNLNLTNGGQVNASTFGEGDSGLVEINATDTISVQGETSQGNFSGVFSTVRSDASGNSEGISIFTDNLNLTNGGQVNATTLGAGNSGLVDITSENINLRDGGLISAEAVGEGNGGNLNIDTNFIVAFPDGNNDIIASAAQGQGGNININAESVFGIQERPLSNSTNDINASSEVSGLDGSINIETLDFNPLQGIIEIVTGIVEPEQTTAQACNDNREEIAKQGNGLTVKGQGGIVPAPDLPLNSHNALIDGKTDAPIASKAQSVSTSLGNIIPARGVRVAKNGQVRLTAHAINNKQRGYKGSRNCGVLY